MQMGGKLWMKSLLQRGPATALPDNVGCTEMTLILLIARLNRTTCVGSQSLGSKPVIYVWVGMSVFLLNY